MWELLEQVKNKKPLVHTITNHVTSNDVANAMLAIGASPIMAEYHGEVEEITERASALVLNLGLLHPDKLLSMKKAGRIANRKKLPVILDPVGCMASSFREQAVAELLSEVEFAVIRGNFSEMRHLLEGGGKGKGVDADENSKELAQRAHVAQQLAKKHCCVTVITGATDIVSDGEDAFCLSNGSPLMEQITGMGCVLSGLIGAMVAANPERTLDAVLRASCGAGRRLYDDSCGYQPKSDREL